MNVKEEVQLAIDMGIESALEFVYVAKENYCHNYYPGHYLGYFNGKLRILSTASSYYKWDSTWTEGGFKAGLGNWTKSQWDYDEVMEEILPDRYWNDRLFHLQYDLRRMKKIEEKFKNSLLRNNLENAWYLYKDIIDCGEQIKKIETKIRVLKNPDFYVNNNYDIEKIKTVPLNMITEILPSGFFVNNPFRQEHSPSNSLHWDKKSNRWTDFGSSRHGDSIDLFQAINQCDLKTALKELSKMV